MNARSRSLARGVFPLAMVAGTLVFAACDTPISTAPPPASRARVAPVASAAASAKPVEYTENDFTESDRNRDPFRSFLAPAQQQGPKAAPNQRKVELAEYNIEDLKLVAIVLGDEPRAMFVDPRGFGTVVYKNTYICRADQVHIGGATGADYQINWRIDRIRDGEVVLIRYDPAQPAVPPATRIIQLHPEADKEQAKG